MLTALLVVICAGVASGQVENVAAVKAADDEPRIADLQLANTGILQALDILLAGTGRNYMVAQGSDVSGTVNVTLQDVPLDTAVKTVLRSAGLTASRENRTYFIEPIKPPVVAMVPMTRAPTLTAKPPIGTMDVKPSGTEKGVKFDILLDKANVLEAMHRIFESVGQNYVIDTGLDSAWAGPLGPRISARMRGITLDEAVQALGRSAGLVVAHIGSTYSVRPPDGALPFTYVPGIGAKPGNQLETAPVCGRCGRALDPSWLYCPQCGGRTRAATTN